MDNCYSECIIIGQLTTTMHCNWPQFNWVKKGNNTAGGQWSVTLCFDELLTLQHVTSVYRNLNVAFWSTSLFSIVCFLRNSNLSLYNTYIGWHVIAHAPYLPYKNRLKQLTSSRKPYRSSRTLSTKSIRRIQLVHLHFRSRISPGGGGTLSGGGYPARGGVPR